MDIQYGQLENLHWLWFVAAVAITSLIAIVLQRRALHQFATENLLGRVIHNSDFYRKIGSALITLIALSLIVIGLVDIRWGKMWREVPQKGIEIIFALDVSRSMLAEDAAPNRLARAKQDIKDIVDEMSGDRVGLVLFAGDVRRHIPLTSHYEDFKNSLDEVGPHNIDRGGSNLGQAITVAADSFLEKTADHKAIVLITDGEDHESQPLKAAAQAYQEKGVRIYTVGLGDMDNGARIPLQSGRRGPEYVRHQGEQVWSKLNGETLKQIATTTDGAYIPAGTKQVDMGMVYRRFISGIQQQEFNTAKINTYIPRYQWFFGFALGLLMLDVLISTWNRLQRDAIETRAFESMGLEKAA